MVELTNHPIRERDPPKKLANETKGEESKHNPPPT